MRLKMFGTLSLDLTFVTVHHHRKTLTVEFATSIFLVNTILVEIQSQQNRFEIV